jgi:peptidoglycan/LPS O-acetylase OafA/YrhL
MKTKVKKSRFISGPSWALSLLAVIIIAIIVAIINGMNVSISDNIKNIIWGVLIAIACFFICWNDPKSIWYVPILCNILILLVAIFDESFWTTPFGGIMFCGLYLSIITAIIGAKIGRRAADQNTVSEE